ncbi:MAG: hypothetical protein AAF846_03180 [Chloroflexota bacterium]
MAKPIKRKKARELRRKRWKITDIASKVDVRRETVSKWCQDIELTDEQIKVLAKDNPRWLILHEAAQQTKREALHQRLAYQEAGRQRAVDGSILHLKGCILYWGEGAKSRNHLRFTNTDPHMIKLFMQFLREEFQVTDDVIYLHIMHHTIEEDEIDAIEQYWLHWLDLSAECTVKMQLKKGTKSRKTHYENGICAICVNNTEILHHIYGAIQEYLGFDNPDWLK